jgi:hypothetical protein
VEGFPVHSKSHAHLGAFCLALSVLGLAACNTLLGLDGYREGTNVIIQDAGTDVEPQVDAGDAEVLKPPTGTVSESWAKWRIPHSSDASTLLFVGRYEERDGSVLVQVSPDTATDRKDPLTFGATHGTAATFEDANKYCKTLGSNFRVPTRIELITLLDYDKAATTGKLFPPGFTNPGDGSYWTASFVQPIAKPITYWFVNTGTGIVDFGVPKSAGVVCILGAVR